MEYIVLIMLILGFIYRLINYNKLFEDKVLNVYLLNKAKLMISQYALYYIVWVLICIFTFNSIDFITVLTALIVLFTFFKIQIVRNVD